MGLAEFNDAKLEEDAGIRTYYGAITPDISNLYTKSNPDYRSMGGPVYVQLSEKVPIEATFHSHSSATHSTKKRLLTSTANTFTDNIETTY